jgi:sarcosine dehydrogenase
VKLNSDIDFYGRAALQQQNSKGLKKRLATFTVNDSEIMLFGRETLYRNDNRVGWLSSGGYGYTIDQNIGFGCVRDAQGVDLGYLKSGDYSLEVAAQRVPCELHLSPLYDPQMEKVKA